MSQSIKKKISNFIKSLWIFLTCKLVPGHILGGFRFSYNMPCVPILSLTLYEWINNRWRLGGTGIPQSNAWSPSLPQPLCSVVSHYLICCQLLPISTGRYFIFSEKIELLNHSILLAQPHLLHFNTPVLQIWIPHLSQIQQIFNYFGNILSYVVGNHNSILFVAQQSINFV